MSITEFLLARIAEDEAAARAATKGPWRYNPRKAWYEDPVELELARAGNPFAIGAQEFVGAGPDDGRNETTVAVAVTGPENHPQAMADAAHMARWDPERALTECQAKRALIDMAEGNAQGFDNEACCHDVEEIRRGECRNYPHGILPEIQLAAAVYKDHPDYDKDWEQ